MRPKRQWMVGEGLIVKPVAALMMIESAIEGMMMMRYSPASPMLSVCMLLLFHVRSGVMKSSAIHCRLLAATIVGARLYSS